MNSLTIPYKTGRLLILADLHCNTYARLGQHPIVAHGLDSDLIWDFDALIIAGDLANGPPEVWRDWLESLARFIPLERVYVLPGNHDYYRHRLDDSELARHTREAGARFVQKTELRHGTTRLLCCTLWTDFDLSGDRAEAMASAGQFMMDYQLIEKASPDTPPLSLDEVAWARPVDITPEDTLALHRDHRGWLEEALQRPHFAGDAGQSVAITHHGPHPATAGPIDALTAAFHSDLSDLILRHQPDAWFFGHSHRRFRAQVGATDIRNVSLGYPGEADLPGCTRIADGCVWEGM